MSTRTPEDFEGRLASHHSAVYHELRPAQRHVLSEYIVSHSETRDLAIQLPTGVGKTLIALLIADYALDQGRAVAYLTGTKQLAEQVEDQAAGLPNLRVQRFYGGHYPGSALDDYHQAQAVGVMNYWVYFNASPKVQPADLLIFDDAHLAEQPLTSLSSLRIGRDSEKALYSQLCDIVLAHSGAYAGLQAMRDGAAPGSTPPELLAFNDWSHVAAAAASAIDASAFVSSGDGQFVWSEVRGRIERCGVLIGPSAIEIRPYLPPTRTNRWYSKARQRIYLSATLGSMEDLQRRLGVEPVTALDVPPALHREATGRRLLLLNPTSEPALSAASLAFALEQARRSGRVAWLCSSHYEADQVQGHLRKAGLTVYRLIPGDDAELERWLSSPKGHLIAAGRYDGLDLAGDVCRLVILPSVPSASTEFERFVVAYLGDARFMRHRIGQRVTQALGRANRTDEDWAIYLGLDPAFGSALAQPDVRKAMGRDVTLHNYLIRQPQSHRLVRLAVLDEAWRLVESPFLEPLMREGRAFGLGVVIASQFPTDLPTAVAGSTATKIYFSQANVEQIRDIQRTILGKTSGGDADHLASIMRGLPPLTCVLYSKQYPRFVRVTVNPYFARQA